MDISIRTAQHVNIAYQPAGLVNRIGATLIDLAFLGGIYILCFTLASLSSISGTPRQPLSYWSF